MLVGDRLVRIGMTSNAKLESAASGNRGLRIDKSRHILSRHGVGDSGRQRPGSS